MKLSRDKRHAQATRLGHSCTPHTSSSDSVGFNYLASWRSNTELNSRFYNNKNNKGIGRGISQAHEKYNSFNSEIQDMFTKCFVYKKHSNLKSWNLPKAEVLFKEYYQFQTLQELKIHLNQVKSKLNKYALDDWSKHTRRKDPSVMIPWRIKSETNAEFVTHAWCKLYECLGRFPELIKSSQVNTLHLCEAPGAFINALNHYMYTNYNKNEVKWNWLATSLNPFYEGNHVRSMISDSRFIIYTLDNWLFHKDFTGNIIDAENLVDLKQQCEQRLGDIHLITADGSFECIDTPECQEERVALLLYAEIIAALKILSNGGSFIIKMFTLFEASSVSKMFLLNCVFETVHVFKPCTSKRGNSEVYVVCLNYKKQTKNLPEILEEMMLKLSVENSMVWPLFAKSVFPEEFLKEHEICCRMFMNYQINAIEENICSYETPQHKNIVSRLQSLKEAVCDEFCKRYNIRELHDENKILYKFKKRIDRYGTEIRCGFYVEREMFRDSSKEEKVFKFRKRLNDLEKRLIHLQQNENKCQVTHSNLENNSSIKLNLYRGKCVTTLNSSHFVDYHIFTMRSELNELFADDIYDACWLQQPRVEFNSNGLLSSINFNDTETIDIKFSLKQETFFKNLILNLLTAKPKEIKFVNMPFLTHYAVSILCYLSCSTYSKVLFSMDSKFEITLALCSANFVASLEELKAAVFSSSEEDIMCFVDILELHHNDFNENVYTFNNKLLLENFQHLLNNQNVL